MDIFREVWHAKVVKICGAKSARAKIEIAPRYPEENAHENLRIVLLRAALIRIVIL